MFRNRKTKKKRGFFMNWNWTGCIISIIISAPIVFSGQAGVGSEIKAAPFIGVEVKIIDPGSETSLHLKLKTAKEELNVLRKELIEILEKNEKQVKTYQRVIQATTEILGDKPVGTQSENEINLITSMKMLVDVGQKLVLQTIKICRYLESEIEKAPLGEVDKIRLKHKLSELHSSSQNFGLLIFSHSEKVIKQIRVLSISRKIGVIVLSSGYYNGIRNGLKLYLGENKEIEVEVVSIRPFICATLIIKGNYKDITPGMKVFLSK